MSDKIAYLDCHSGISGDMFLSAMLDAGLPLETLRNSLAALPIEGYQITQEPFIDQGIRGTHVEVELTEQEQPTRSFTDIAALLQASSLSPFVRDTAIAIFRTLGEAEATVHGVALDEIHFHEVGAVDAIVDITGAAIAVETLGIMQLYASPLPLTRGHLRMAHGLMPIPAPATLEILRRVQAPWLPSPIEGELVTPTGAAILATLARFQMPAMTMEQIGYGFGKKRLIWPNCLRACIGHAYNQGITHQAVAQHIDHEHHHHHILEIH
jgi:pyridinium-3,5-bisthiocarboxylic acid mononucleotide nickel chelatase